MTRRRPSHRGLYQYRGRIWYERRIGKRRFRENTGIEAEEPDAWNRAIVWRDEYEKERAITAGNVFLGIMPTFATLTQRYLDEDTGHLAPTTQTDRRSHLAVDGPVLRHIGSQPLDLVQPPTLREWWNREIQAAGRSVATGHRYLASIAGVLNYAVELGYIRDNPVDSFRRQLSRRRRSKSGRAAQESLANPIEDPGALERLIAESRAEGPEVVAVVLAMLDAGLRVGEAMALRWRSVAWGTDENDPRRHLLVDESFSRASTEVTPPKSGRCRRVQLSLRLRRALGELYLSHDPRPDRGALLFPFGSRRFRDGPWAAILERADLPGRTPKDLRDTFASQLVSAGIPILYVSRQLGHSTTAVTERHYAKWIPGDGDLYVEPINLEAGEVPGDLLARLRSHSPQIPHTGDPFDLPEVFKPPELH